MKNVVGIFATRADAEAAVECLRAAGIHDGKINLLTPDSSDRDLAAVRTSDTEQPGTGKAIGAVVGTAVGASAGASVPLLIPGVGPVIAIGMAAMALLGAAGAVGGAVVGGSLEASLQNGLPKDELFFYEDALRRGHTVVIALVDDDADAAAARRVFREAGAEDLDRAREQWWIGIRNVEGEAYDREHGDFARDEEPYRHGFEAALHPEFRGRTYREVEPGLRARYGALCDAPSFRRGFERGTAYRERVATPASEPSGRATIEKEARRA